MKLTAQIQYGVRSLCDIAYYSAGSPVNLKRISERQGISHPFIDQIFRNLAKVGMVRSLRGPGGGYFLARRPEEISVGDVIRAVEGKNMELVGCHGDKRESRKPVDRLEKCTVSEIWRVASKRLMDYFDSITLEQICEETRERGVGILNLLALTYLPLYCSRFRIKAKQRVIPGSPACWWEWASGISA